MSYPIQILVLENESFARMLVRALKGIGVEEPVQSGALITARDALRVVQTNPILTGVSVDFNLFGATTGVDFAAQAKALRPDLLMVLLSGNMSGARKHPSYRPDLFVREVEKPVDPEVYAGIWREVLAAAGKLPQ